MKVCHIIPQKSAREFAGDCLISGCGKKFNCKETRRWNLSVIILKKSEGTRTTILRDVVTAVRPRGRRTRRKEAPVLAEEIEKSG